MRRKGVRAAAVGLSLATLVASGCTAKHAQPTANPTPTAGAPSSVTSVAADALRPHRCRAQITNARLTAPFWLEFDHFDPSHRQPKHSLEQALDVYRTSPNLRVFTRRPVNVAYADYSDLNGRRRPTTAVWIAVSYGVAGPSLAWNFSKPMKVAQVVIINDKDLRPRSTIQALPTRCA